MDYKELEEFCKEASRIYGIPSYLETKSTTHKLHYFIFEAGFQAAIKFTRSRENPRVTTEEDLKQLNDGGHTMPIEPTLSEYRYDIESFYYLSDDTLIPRAIEDTDLSLLELEEIVGRFAKHSCRAGQLRGKIVTYLTGKIQIRHHFTNKLLWENN